MKSAVLFNVFFFGIIFAAASAEQDSALDQQRKLFLQAEQALASGDSNRFGKLMENLGDYPLYSYLNYQAANKTPLRPERIKQFLDHHGDSRYAAPLRGKLLDFLAAKGRWNEYIANYRSTRNVERQCHYYGALYRLGRKQEAFAGARSLWLVGSSQPKACDPLFSAWQESPRFDSKLAWQRYELAMEKGNLQLATYLKRFLPVSEQKYADLWQQVHRQPLRLKDCAGASDHHPLQGKIFVHGIDRLARTAPGLAQAIWIARQHQFELTALDRERINKRLAMAHAFRRDPQAFRLLSAIDDEWADADVRTWRLRAALINGDWKGVLSAFSRMSDAERADPHWRYWQGRALESLGQSERAQIILREVAEDRSFHGFLAADRVKSDYALANRPAEIADSAVNDLAQTLPFRAVREFRYFGREGDARRQWWHAVRNFERPALLAAAKLAQQWGWHQVAIFTISRAEHWDDLQLRFPIGYRDTITAHAVRSELPPEIIFGVIRRESAFDGYARSPVGARGLMQIMPKTGQAIARSLNEKWSSARALYDPDINVRYGTTYLKGLMDRFSNNLALAAAAYNAGPHRVDRWLPDTEAMPADIWVEEIPYRETRHYVAAVLAYAVIYRQRLGLEIPKISTYLGEVAPLQSEKPQQLAQRPVLEVCQP